MEEIKLTKEQKIEFTGGKGIEKSEEATDGNNEE